MSKFTPMPAKVKITKVGRCWPVDGGGWIAKDWEFENSIISGSMMGAGDLFCGHAYNDLAKECVLKNPRIGDSWICEGRRRSIIDLTDFQFKLSGGGGMVISREPDGRLPLVDGCKDFNPIPSPSQASGEQPKGGHAPLCGIRSARSDYKCTKDKGHSGDHGTNIGHTIYVWPHSESRRETVELPHTEAAAWLATHPKPGEQQAQVAIGVPDNDGTRQQAETGALPYNALHSKCKKCGEDIGPQGHCMCPGTGYHPDQPAAEVAAIKSVKEAQFELPPSSAPASVGREFFRGMKIQAGDTLTLSGSGIGHLARAFMDYDTLKTQLAQRDRELAEAKSELDRLADLPLCRRQLPNGRVPGNIEQALRDWVAAADSLTQQLAAEKRAAGEWEKLAEVEQDAHAETQKTAKEAKKAYELAQAEANTEIERLTMLLDTAKAEVARLKSTTRAAAIEQLANEMVSMDWGIGVSAKVFELRVRMGQALALPSDPVEPCPMGPEETKLLSILDTWALMYPQIEAIRIQAQKSLAEAGFAVTGGGK